MADDAETKGKIEETVRKILEESDMDEITESKIRKLASKQLGLDLSEPHFKAFVKQVVKAFIHEKHQEEQEDGSSEDKEYDDNGDLIICKLSEKRRVTIQDFRGISLTEEQWSTFKKNVPAIEEAIKKLESRNV